MNTRSAHGVMSQPPRRSPAMDRSLTLGASGCWVVVGLTEIQRPISKCIVDFLARVRSSGHAFVYLGQAECPQSERHNRSCHVSQRKGTPTMTSPKTIRDPITDHMLTPQSAALVIIDFQPVQVTSVASMDRRTLVANIAAVARTAKLYDLPVVLSSVNVKTGRNQPTIHQITDVLPDVEVIDRTSINAWEDDDFVAAVKATGRKKLIMAALWTEVCLVFPVLDALQSGYEVYPLVDAV